MPNFIEIITFAPPKSKGCNRQDKQGKTKYKIFFNFFINKTF
jgi:hypothetical protein